MPSPFSEIGRKCKDLFRSRSRDRRQASNPSTDEGGPSSAPPLITTGLLTPGATIAVTQPVVDVTSCGTNTTNKTQDTSARASAPPLARPSIDAKACQTLPIESLPTSSFPGTSYSNTPPSSAPSPALGTSFFSNAHDFAVANLVVQNNQVPSKSLFECTYFILSTHLKVLRDFPDLNPHVAHGAAHNSDERWNAPSCHEETRVAIREDIVSWVKHGDRDAEPKDIMWLSGPAGSGKSAIAGSVAETCETEGLLAATFFFSSFAGSSERSSKRGLFPTLAYHISQNPALHQFKVYLHAAVDSQPDIFRKNLKEQAKCLILEPFGRMHNSGSTVGWPKVVIIDGLDEVVAEAKRASVDQSVSGASEDDQGEILRALLALSKDPSFPFRIFISSRPEHVIEEFFSTSARDTTVNLFLDGQCHPNCDIKRFLKSKFADIRRRTGISNPLWPGEDAIEHLVGMSSGQFIVPVTVIRWVESGLPQRQLDDIMNVMGDGSQNPFATLDALYRHILKRANNPSHDSRLVVKWIKCIDRALLADTNTVLFWKPFLEDEEGELRYRLAPINSLISVRDAVPGVHDSRPTLYIHHKSFTDFLSSPARCGDLYVDEMEQSSFLVERIFLILKSESFYSFSPFFPASATVN